MAEDSPTERPEHSATAERSTRDDALWVELVQRAVDLAGPGRCAVLGITGKPGAGKTLLAQALVGAIGARSPADGVPVAYAPMDGFHLADAQLERLGLRDRKGAPDTFDAAGYAAMLARVHAGADDVVYAPGFERDLEQPIAAAVAVPRVTRLLVTEGNYLLHAGDEWQRVRRLLDEVWYCEVGDELRISRLIARHVEFGKAPDDARAWVHRSDEANAALIETTRHQADLVVDMDRLFLDPNSPTG